MSVLLNLNKDYVEKTMKQANERAMKEYKNDENAPNMLLYQFEGVTWEIDTDENVLRLIADDTPIGSIYLDTVLDVNAQIELLNIVVKRMNKMKTLLESLK